MHEGRILCVEGPHSLGRSMCAPSTSELTNGPAINPRLLLEPSDFIRETFPCGI
jgi:hypothetical protein